MLSDEILHLTFREIHQRIPAWSRKHCDRDGSDTLKWSRCVDVMMDVAAVTVWYRPECAVTSVHLQRRSKKEIVKRNVDPKLSAL